MPAELAARGPGGIVGPRSPDRAEQFQRLLESFFNEARLLAPFNHPALVRVHRFWKANGTAYMAMQYCPGMTLMQARGTMRAPPDEAWLRAVVEPILDALERLHRAGVFHRDISPDNILLLPNGRPILLDFGSARRVVGSGTKSLTAVLKPNFAPVEQYGDSAGMAQGPWTDLYALGATVHFMLTGEVPMPAVMRVVKDQRTPLAAAGGAAFPGVGASSSPPSTGPRRSRRRIDRKASRRCAMPLATTSRPAAAGRRAARERPGGARSSRWGWDLRRAGRRCLDARRDDVDVRCGFAAAGERAGAGDARRTGADRPAPLRSGSGSCEAAAAPVAAETTPLVAAAKPDATPSPGHGRDRRSDRPPPRSRCAPAAPKSPSTGAPRSGRAAPPKPAPAATSSPAPSASASNARRRARAAPRVHRSTKDRGAAAAPEGPTS